jgi:dihydroorotase
MIDMPTTLSKMLALGMPLADVIRAATWTPAQMIRHEELGHLSEGAPADIAVFRLAEGSFGFADAAGGAITATRRLFCELTLRQGQVVWDWNARAATDYRLLEPTYGIRPGIDSIIPPPGGSAY